MAGELSRRSFVQAALAALIASGGGLVALLISGNKGAVVPASPTTSTSGRSPSTFSTASTSSTASTTGGEPNVFRISARHVRHPCNSCVAHARNRYYKSADAAAADLAHKGCRCEVRGQAIPESQLASMFTGSHSVFDKRTA